MPCGGTSSSHSLPPGRQPAKSVVSPMATPAHRSGCRTTHMHCERGKGEGRGERVVIDSPTAGGDSPNLKDSNEEFSEHHQDPSTDGVDGVVESHWRLALQPPHAHLHKYHGKEIRRHLPGSEPNNTTH